MLSGVLLGLALALGTGAHTGAALAAEPADAPDAVASASPAPMAKAAAVNQATAAAEPATLRLLNREVVTLRTHLGGLTPQLRVQRVAERLREMPPAAATDPLNVVSVSLDGRKGVQFMLGDRLLFAVLEADVDVESQQTFEALVKTTQTRLQEVKVAYHEMSDKRLLLQGGLRTGGATLVLALLIWATYRASRLLVQWMEQRRDRVAAHYPYIDIREFVARLAVTSVRLVQLFVLLTLGYFWFFFVLGSFIVTAPLAQRMGTWLWDKLIWIADGALTSLPGLATVAIVLVLTRAIVDGLGYFFDAVQKDRLRLPWFHRETANATRRIFSLVVWALGLAVAYPFLPGSSSEAFKGVSVLIGLMLTLGSTGLITQAMSGLVVVYSRSLHKGDFVDVNGVQGVVTEVASLATKIVNLRNEEITIPNAVLIANPIHNYSKPAGNQGTLLTTQVTIGYDAPWRQVHELLIGAARATAGVRESPAPYVYQRALSDFYVEYELFVSIDKPLERVPILSALLASIQDGFNEHGVQIMSPHFHAQPEQAVLVPKAQRYAAPAKRP